jgi:SAM-dependent methyltransferase
MADGAILTEAVRMLTHDPALSKPVMILEAGCGSTSHVEWPFEKRIVGIDIDPEQLERNEIADEKILGDLQTFELPRNLFDLVVCVDVMEHLPFPEKAFANMGRSLKSGGCMLIACPEPYSYKGFVAKYTPHSMRHNIFKLLTGKSHTVLLSDGIQKTFFPTYLKPLCSRSNLRKFAMRSGLAVLFERAYDGHSKGLHARFQPLLGMANYLTRSIEWATDGRINLLLADYVLLLKKGEQ